MLRYTAIHPDGRLVVAEVVDGQVRVTRRLGSGCAPECVEIDDRLGLEARGIEAAVEQWYREGWRVTAEEIGSASGGELL